MIEICDRNIYYKRRTYRKKRRFFLLIIILFCGVFFFYNSIITNNVFNIAIEHVSAYSIESVNQAVMDSTMVNYSYSDYVQIERNADGEIALISAKADKVNYVSREIERIAAEKLEAKLINGIPIPILAFSGVKILSGYGKKVYFKPVVISKVVCSFDSEFKSAGLNQTIHSVYVNVLVTVNTVMPFSNNQSAVNSKVLICESVIVGKVPQIYYGGKLFD